MANWVPSSPMRPIQGRAGQNLTISGTAAQGAPVGPNTYAVRLSSTGNCHVAIGMSPGPAATDMLIKASDPPVIVKIAPGENVAVIQDGTATGTLNVIEMTN